MQALFFIRFLMMELAGKVEVTDIKALVGLPFQPWVKLNGTVYLFIDLTIDIVSTSQH